MSQPIIGFATTTVADGDPAEKRYVFRPLSARDISPMLKIVRKIGLKDIAKVFSTVNLEDFKTAQPDAEETTEETTEPDAEKDALTEKIGIGVALDLLDVVIGAIDRIQPDLDALLASCSNLSVEEIADLPIAEYIGMIAEFVQKPEFRDCFKAAAKLIK